MGKHATWEAAQRVIPAELHRNRPETCQQGNEKAHGMNRRNVNRYPGGRRNPFLRVEAVALLPALENLHPQGNHVTLMGQRSRHKQLNCGAVRQHDHQGAHPEIRFSRRGGLLTQDLHDLATFLEDLHHRVPGHLAFHSPRKRRRPRSRPPPSKLARVTKNGGPQVQEPAHSRAPSGGTYWPLP